MERIVTIKKGDTTYAQIFHAVSANGSIRFLTEQQDEFQLGVMERSAGYQVKPHTHPREEKIARGLTEFLYIEKGAIRVTVFDEEWKELGQETLGVGDFLLFLRGGHSIDVLEECRMIEVKQGPYPGAENAKHFRPAA